MRDLIGQQLGNYRLLRLLGSGGFADVYIGQHLHLDMYAAIKVLHTSITGTHISDIQREAQTIANLRHPHIIRLLDFDIFNGVTFLAMEYATGGSVLQKYPVGSILSLSNAVAYAQQLGAALHYAHTYQIIHRDVKPANILIDQHGALLLGDFGIARLLQHQSASTSTHSIAGTAPYMAPEQIQGRPCTASDQYALGIVLYEWLCGRRPFLGGPNEIALQHLVAAPPLLRHYNATLPSAVENVILRALAKKPEQRFPDVEEFIHALEAASQQRSFDLDYSRDEEISPPFSILESESFQIPPLPPQEENIFFPPPFQETTRMLSPELERAYQQLSRQLEAENRTPICGQLLVRAPSLYLGYPVHILDEAEWIRHGQFPRLPSFDRNFSIRQGLATATHIKTYRMHGQAVQAAVFRNISEGEYIVWQENEHSYISVFVSQGQTTQIDLPRKLSDSFIL